MTRLIMLALLPLAACNPDPAARCEQAGGQMVRGMIGEMCAMPTPDAGQACTSSSDCSSSMCLAETRSCAPITPMFGCIELLEDDGPVTLCID